MTKTGHETLVIDESNTIDAGGGWRRLDKIETTGSVEIRVNNLLVRSISSGGSIRADGSINADAWVRSGEAISSGGSIRAGDSISAGAWISAGGSISSGGLISSDAWISAGVSISAEGKISAGGSIICRVLYWGMLALPECTEIVVTHAVRPPEWQREHWANRLGVKMPEYDCYDEIERQYAGRLPEWLARTDLLPVERLILESHTPEARTKAEARAKELRDAIKQEGNK